MKNITNSECNAKPCLQGNVFVQCASSEVIAQSLSDTKPTIHETKTKHAMRIIWIASLHTSIYLLLYFTHNQHTSLFHTLAMCVTEKRQHLHTYGGKSRIPYDLSNHFALFQS